MNEQELTSAVDAAFERRARGLARWPDPHRGRSPDDDEYSRVTDTTKWLIVGARCDAWTDALTEAGLATVERDAGVRWEARPSAVISRVDRITPIAPGALDFVIARGRIGDVADAGVTIGVGDPVIELAWIPDCGCDACDAGSQMEIDRVDEWLGGIVSGTFRRLGKGDRRITVIGTDGWGSRGLRRWERPEKIIANPRGWTEISGSSWL